MENIFSDETETTLLAQRSMILPAPSVDAKQLALLEGEVKHRLELFLKGDLEVDPQESPLFYSFIKVFSETDDPDLKMCAKKAEAKIIPLLKQFDQSAGYEQLMKVSPEEMERNLSDLDGFEKINPFECDDQGRLIFTQFRLVKKVLDNVEITDDENTSTLDAGEANETFQETILETARLKTYMRLCVSCSEITQADYLDTLQMEMEKALVILFVMDKTSEVKYPLDGFQAEKIHNEFKKLIDTLE